MQSELENAKRTIVLELKDLGYSDKEVKSFKKTLKCPSCGYEFFNLKNKKSKRWLLHLAHCRGAIKKTKGKRQWLIKID